MRLTINTQSLTKRIGAYVCVSLVGLLICLYTPKAQAQTLAELPSTGTLINTTEHFEPMHMLGMSINPENPFEFEFILNAGSSQYSNAQVSEEAQTLIQYFLTTLTIPSDALWVNLSPFEKQRIISDQLGQTEMGRDLLAQDYLLKQLVASLIHPDTPTGQLYWSKLRELEGHEPHPKDVFNKIWILPDQAQVHIDNLQVTVTQSNLKVMLESDYLALKHHSAEDTRAATGQQPSEQYLQIIRETLLPTIEKEVNYGETFAELRQIFHSMILATWYKKNLKSSFLSRAYVDQIKIQGIDTQPRHLKHEFYERYVESFTRGVFNFVKEDLDPQTQEIIPRQYFSGGVIGVDEAMITESTQSVSLQTQENLLRVKAYLQPEGLRRQSTFDAAMKSPSQVTDKELRRQMRSLYRTLSQRRKAEGLPALTTVERGDLLVVAQTAKDLHREHRRLSGDLYFVHPLEVVEMIINEFGIVDPELIQIALLHDAREDHVENYMEVAEFLSKKVKLGIRILSKLKGAKYDHLQDREAEYHKRLLDPKQYYEPDPESDWYDEEFIRAIQLIKIADRLANINDLREIFEAPVELTKARQNFPNKQFQKTLTVFVPEFILKSRHLTTSDKDFFFTHMIKILENYAGISAEENAEVYEPLINAALNALPQYVKLARSHTIIGRDSAMLSLAEAKALYEQNITANAVTSWEDLTFDQHVAISTFGSVEHFIGAITNLPAEQITIMLKVLGPLANDFLVEKGYESDFVYDAMLIARYYNDAPISVNDHIIPLGTRNPQKYYRTDVWPKKMQELMNPIWVPAYADPMVMDAMITLNHPSLPRFRIHNNQFETQWVLGPRLSEWAQSNDALDLSTEEFVDRLIEWLEQLNDGLQLAHQNGIFHGDLGPSNIIIDRVTNKAVFIDWGDSVGHSDTSYFSKLIYQTLLARVLGQNNRVHGPGSSTLQLLKERILIEFDKRLIDISETEFDSLEDISIALKSYQKSRTDQAMNSTSPTSTSDSNLHDRVPNHVTKEMKSQGLSLENLAVNEWIQTARARGVDEGQYVAAQLGFPSELVQPGIRFTLEVNSEYFKGGDWNRWFVSGRQMNQDRLLTNVVAALPNNEFLNVGERTIFVGPMPETTYNGYSRDVYMVLHEILHDIFIFGLTRSQQQQFQDQFFPRETDEVRSEPNELIYKSEGFAQWTQALLRGQDNPWLSSDFAPFLTEIGFDLQSMTSKIRKIQPGTNTETQMDSAMQAPGGIDLNSAHLHLTESGNALNFKMKSFHVDYSIDQIHGFQPIIINISPITPVPLLMENTNSSDTPFISRR